ncbi:hypothetical protein TNCV_3635331 [Trichonephila clavipes]|nr:hypothetical protein TNCV_3635331 [Trichonephila clavipes]
MSSGIPTVAKSSTPTQAHLLPSTSSVAIPTSSESQPPIPLIHTAPATSISMFSPLPPETSPVLETTTTSNTIPFTSQAPKKKKKKNPSTGKSVLTKVLPHTHSLKPKVEIQMEPHKPRKSTPLQDTSDKDMLVYDVEEERRRGSSAISLFNPDQK